MTDVEMKMTEDMMIADVMTEIRGEVGTTEDTTIDVLIMTDGTSGITTIADHSKIVMRTGAGHMTLAETIEVSLAATPEPLNRETLARRSTQADGLQEIRGTNRRPGMTRDRPWNRQSLHPHNQRQLLPWRPLAGISSMLAA